MRPRRPNVFCHERLESRRLLEGRNALPVAIDDAYVTVEDTPAFFVVPDQGVLSNDRDSDGDPLVARLVNEPQHGTATLRADGGFFYRPDADFFGFDEFQYRAEDLRASSVARVVIWVRASNYDPAEAVSDTYRVSPDGTSEVFAEVGLLANDHNPDRVPLTAILERNVADGNLQLESDGSFRYQANGFVGTTQFHYRVDDGVQVSAPAEVVLVINTPPEPYHDVYVMEEDRTLAVDAVDGVLANDIDAEDDALSVTLSRTIEIGELELAADGSFEYRPPKDFSGDVTFDYQVSDGKNVSQSTVHIQVQRVNHVPVSDPDLYTVEPGGLLVVRAVDGVLQNDTDFDGTELTVRLSDMPKYGNLTLAADGGFTYWPQNNYVGTDSFSYQAFDGDAVGPETQVSIVVQPINRQDLVIITELHYDPIRKDKGLEFIELFNRGSVSVDVSGWQISDGVAFTFPNGTKLGPQRYLTVAQDPVALGAVFGVSAFGPWSGRLRNGGETVTLEDSFGRQLDRVDYRLGFPWPTVGDEPDRSIQLMNTDFSNHHGSVWRSAPPNPGMGSDFVAAYQPPLIDEVEHQPRSPRSGEPVTIRAKVTGDVQVVQLEYQIVDPGAYIGRYDTAYATTWTVLSMRDDGRRGDERAGDNVYTVRLSADHRRLVRYRIGVVDRHDTQWQAPRDDDPQPNFAYFVYDGVPSWTGADRPGVTEPVTYGSDVMNSLPVYHLIADTVDVQQSQYQEEYNNRRYRGTLVYDGVVYDHIEFKVRGQWSTYVTGKNKWKLFFNRGHEFQGRDEYGRAWDVSVRQLNFGTAASPWSPINRGLAGMDEALAFKFFNLAGVAAPHISPFQLRVIDAPTEADSKNQYEGDLWGLYLAFEDPSGSFLDNHGLPDGNLFHMQQGNTELEHQALGLPGDSSDRRVFTSTRTGYNVRPSQPEAWWRQHVDLPTYYSYRAVVEAINHADLRDQENSLLFFNARTQQWTMLPWDLDFLYGEFQVWGPLGVNQGGTLEQFRLSLEHEPILLEFQSHLREMQDLLFNRDQAWQAIDEYANKVAAFAAVDRAMWDYHPRTSDSHRGFFYKHPVAITGPVRPPSIAGNFDGMVDWVKQFLVEGGYGGELLSSYHRDEVIPQTPVIDYVGLDNYPINALRFTTSDFRGPISALSFAAMQWRVGEVTDPSAPAYRENDPIVYEVVPVWTSDRLTEFRSQIDVDPSALKVGHAYRARVRMQDNTGRWSHWSEPIQFVPSEAQLQDYSWLRFSEIHYHPSDPTVEERLAGFNDADEFEFLELVNTGSEPIDLGGLALTRVELDGRLQGVDFEFFKRVLGPWERLVVVENETAFRFRYGADPIVAGQWTGRLSNASETITLSAFDVTIAQLSYADDWHPGTDGIGASLEAIDLARVTASRSNALSWRASEFNGGTPGTGDIPGDSNRDGIFDEQDLVSVFITGKYEDGIDNNSTFAEGDWDGDGDFTIDDMVYVFVLGNFATA